MENFFGIGIDDDGQIICTDENPEAFWNGVKHFSDLIEEQYIEKQGDDDYKKALLSVERMKNWKAQYWENKDIQYVMPKKLANELFRDAVMYVKLLLVKEQKEAK